MEEIKKLFYGDEVFLMCPTTNVLKIGLVLKGTEWNVKDDSKKIEVMWHLDGNKETISANKVILMDRSLVAGSTVSKFHDGKPVGQLGYCENVDVYTNIKISTTNIMVLNICADNLNTTTAFQIGSPVMFNMWVGEIVDVIQTIIFSSIDGTIFAIEDPFKEHFISLTTNSNFNINDSVFQKFLVGQPWDMSLDALKNVNFLKASREMISLLNSHKEQKCNTWIKVIVQYVDVLSVDVKWCPQQCPATYALKTDMPPKTFIKEDLEKLETLSSPTIHLGDTYLYNINDCDQVIEINQWQHLYAEIFSIQSSNVPQYKIQKSKVYNEFGSEEIAAIKFQKHNHKREKKVELTGISESFISISISDVPSHSMIPKKMRLSPFKQIVSDDIKCYRGPRPALDSSTDVLVEVLNTKTLVDVVWADGTREVGIQSTNLYAIQDDTYSLKYKPGVFVYPENAKSGVYGVIESTKNVERTSRIRVQWFNMNGSSGKVTIIPEIKNESIQNLRYHPMYNLKFGTLVIASEEVPVPPKTYTIGKVMGAGIDGKILVTWSTGKIEKHWPQKLLVIKNGFSYQHIFKDNLLHLISKPNCTRAMNNIEKIEKSLLDLLKQGNDGIRTLTKCIYFTGPSVDLLDEIEEAIELVMKGFYIIPFFACEKFQLELEKIYKCIINLVIQAVETALQKLYGNQEMDEFKDLIDNLFIRLTDKINDYTNKIEEILFKYMSMNQIQKSKRS